MESIDDPEPTIEPIIFAPAVLVGLFGLLLRVADIEGHGGCTSESRG